jgi:hypothetical protein
MMARPFGLLRPMGPMPSTYLAEVPGMVDIDAMIVALFIRHEFDDPQLQASLCIRLMICYLTSLSPQKIRS